MAAPRPVVRNVVSTADLGQAVDIARMSGVPSCEHDPATYGGICGYVKEPGMRGRVSVFASGKMISVGARSAAEAAAQLHRAMHVLAGAGLASEARLRPRVRNVVATVDAGRPIPIDEVSAGMPGAVYDPETFPALIVKGAGYRCSFLVFASGKIVAAGARSVADVRSSSFELLQRIGVIPGGAGSKG